MRFPRLKALGPIKLGEPHHKVSNPLLFNLDYPGHEQHGSSITLRTYLPLVAPIRARIQIMDAIVKGA